MTSGPVLFFPVHTDPAQAEAYANRYIRTVWSASEPTGQAAEAAIQAWVKGAIGERPAALDAERGLQALPQAQREILVKKESIFIHFWRQTYPLLEGEKVLAEQVTFTAEPWNGHPSHILLYERRTDQGELALILPYVHIDPQTGLLDYGIAAQGVLQAPSRLTREALLSSSDGLDIIQGVLGMVTWIGMAVGPEGMVVAAVAGILETIFGLFWPKESPVNLPKVVDDILKQDLAEDHVLKNATTILTYTNWLKEQNQNALQGQMSSIDPVKYKDALTQLKQYVTNACDPSSPLLQAVGDLQSGNYPSDPSYQILALAVFLLGASTHLLFEKCRILFNTDATSFRSPITYELVNTAKAYLAHTQEIVAQIETAFQTRLGGIQDPQQISRNDNGQSGEGGSVNMTWHYIYIQDNQADKDPKQEIVRDLVDVVPENTVWFKQGSQKSCTDYTVVYDWDAARSWKAEYVPGVISGLEKKYNYSAERKADIHKVIAKLQETINLYEPLTK